MTSVVLPDPSTILYSALVLFFAYLIRGIAGFGSGLIAVPFLSLVSPIPVVVPLVVALDFIGSASQGLHNAGQIAWKEQLVLIPFMVVGVAVGLFLVKTVPTPILGRALGGFVIAYAIYQWLPLPTLRASRLAATSCGLLGGLVGTVFGTGGPFYVIYLNLRGLERSVFRATFAANFLIDGGIRLMAYAVMGLFRWETLALLAGALPVAGAGLYLGGHIQLGLSQRVFVRFISALLVVSGLALLSKS